MESPAEPGFEQAQATVEVASAEPAPEPSPEPAAPKPEPAGDDLYPLADPGPYYAGLWCGRPNYKCPYCGFATLDGNASVELHILEKLDQGNKRHQSALELK